MFIDTRPERMLEILSEVPFTVTAMSLNAVLLLVLVVRWFSVRRSAKVRLSRLLTRSALGAAVIGPCLGRYT